MMNRCQTVSDSGMPLIHPFSIASVAIPNNLILAPMAGVADGPFRLVCQDLGAGLTISELASAKGIVLGVRPTMEMVEFSGQKRPYGVQIFGAHPETMARAAQIIESMNICDFIDINMGCPVSKVVKTGAGAALMKTPGLASEIISAVRKAVKVPVTVKCRIGWKKGQINVREFVKMAVDSGAAAVAVHARAKDDGYAGVADWKSMENLQSLCGKIPFISNGDIHSFDDLKKIHEISGCTGFMIGRGAVGSPWIFREIIEAGINKHFGAGKASLAPTNSANSTFIVENAKPNESDQLVSNAGKFEIYRNHLVEMLMEHGPKGVPLFRVHLFGYLRGHPNASQIRRSMCYERNPAVVLHAGKEFYLGGSCNDSSHPC